MEEFSSQPIKRISTSDQVVDRLREAILRGELRPGTPLREVRLAGSLGVSRNTVREGVRVLVAEGLLRHDVHRGVSVAQLKVEDVRDLYRSRRLIESQAIEACLDASDEQLARLAAARAALQTGGDTLDPLDLMTVDLNVHRAIVGLLGSPRISAFYNSLLDEIRLVLATVDFKRPGSSDWPKGHLRLCDAILAGSKTDALQILDEEFDAGERLAIETVALVDESL